MEQEPPRLNIGGGREQLAAMSRWHQHLSLSNRSYLAEQRFAQVWVEKAGDKEERKNSIERSPRSFNFNFLRLQYTAGS